VFGLSGLFGLFGLSGLPGLSRLFGLFGSELKKRVLYPFALSLSKGIPKE